MRPFLKQAPNQCAHNPFGTGGPTDTLYTGVVTVARAGTPAQLTASSTPLRWGVWIVSESTAAGSNDEVVFVGTTDQKPTYDGTAAPVSTGLQCEANNPVFIEINDLSDIWVDADENGLKVSYLAA